MDIGHRMKELRIQYGLTQQELADRAELTKGFISQLERNQNSPSIGTLLDIIQCLGTTPAEFFTDEEPEQIVFKAEDYFEKIDEEKNSRIEWIVPNAQKNAMEPVRMTLHAGGSISSTRRGRLWICNQRKHPYYIWGQNPHGTFRRIILLQGGKETFSGKRWES